MEPFSSALDEVPLREEWTDMKLRIGSFYPLVGQFDLASADFALQNRAR